MTTPEAGRAISPGPDRTLLWVGAAALLAALVVSAVHWTTTTRTGVAVPGIGAEIQQRGKTLGADAAPVTIEVFSDFLCDHCADFALQTEPAIVEEFVRPGIARLVYRHFPIVSPGSATIAAASECAAEQGHFWSYHNALFVRASRGGVRSQADLRAVAKTVGVDDEPFARCLQSGATMSRVEDDRREGERRGVTGTPTSFVNGRAVPGAVPVEVLREAITDARGR
jgi:protein-disulfide isomerase